MKPSVTELPLGDVLSRYTISRSQKASYLFIIFVLLFLGIIIMLSLFQQESLNSYLNWWDFLYEKTFSIILSAIFLIAAWGVFYPTFRRLPKS